MTEITDRTIERSDPRLARALAALIAGVWLFHGLFNKLLHGEPRHLAIVRSVPLFTNSSAAMALAVIGIVEIGVAIWVLSGRRPYACAMAQAALLLPMNVVELIYARPLLLWPAGLIPLNVAFLSLAWFVAFLRGPSCSTR